LGHRHFYQVIQVALGGEDAAEDGGLSKSKTGTHYEKEILTAYVARCNSITAHDAQPKLLHPKWSLQRHQC
jgi:hypothetical protein